MIVLNVFLLMINLIMGAYLLTTGDLAFAALNLATAILMAFVVYKNATEDF